MAFDLEQLRLDIPPESFASQGGVRPFWRAAALTLFAACAGLVAWMVVVPRGPSGAVEVPVHVVAPQAQSELTAFTAGGWVEPEWPHPIVVSADIDGRLETLNVVEGQAVRQGDLIGTLHSLPWRQAEMTAAALLVQAEYEVEALEATLARLRAGYRPEEIAVAKAELESAQTDLALLEAGYRAETITRARAELDAARLRASFLRREAVRSEALTGREFESRSRADRDRAAADEAQAKVRALEAHVEMLAAGPRDEEIAQARAAVAVAQARLSLLRSGSRGEDVAHGQAKLNAAEARLEAAEFEHAIAQRNLRYCMVKAPEDGVVLEILSPQGAWLHGEMRGIVRMYDPGRMQVRVDVRQENAALLKIGQPCTVKLESRKGAAYAGTLERIDPQGNLARDTVRVRVRILEPDAWLRIDLTVTVDFLAGESLPEDAPLVVPVSAVIKRDGRHSVFAVRGGVTRQLEVELGAQTPGGYVVLSGVEAGEVVATGNLAMLEDGTPVALSGETP